MLMLLRMLMLRMHRVMLGRMRSVLMDASMRRRMRTVLVDASMRRRMLVLRHRRFAKRGRRCPPRYGNAIEKSRKREDSRERREERCRRAPHHVRQAVDWYSMYSAVRAATSSPK